MKQERRRFRLKIEELVNKHLQMLNPTDLIVWRYIYAHKKECCYMSIYDMAEACNVSRTTILRFAKKLSLDGFSDLKALLKQEAGRHAEPAPEADIVQATIDLCQRVGNEMAKKDFSRANKLLYRSRRIIAYGSGHVQRNVVNELLRLFVNSGLLLYELKGHDEFGLLLNKLSPDDLFIIVSLSGESPQVVEMAQKLRLSGIPVISITRLKDNTLAGLSTENIYITPVPFPLCIDAAQQPYESLLMYFIVVEIWFVQYHRYQQKQQLSPEASPARES